MGRYIEQNQGRSELQQRIAADLRAKAAAKAKQEGGDAGDDHKRPDGVDDAAYLKGTKATTTLAPAWLLIFIASIAIFVYFIYQVNR